jgi:hypothetical protein
MVEQFTLYYWSRVVRGSSARLWGMLNPIHLLITRWLEPLRAHTAHPIDIGHPDRVAILLVGCGGVGSFTAPILAQLASWALISGFDLRLYFIDPSSVEQKNLVRHNFCSAELGQAKAFSLAWRYSAAFGLSITPVIERFRRDMLGLYKPNHSHSGAITLIISTVDNPRARRDIAEAITAWSHGRLGHRSPHDQIWWLDAGHTLTEGMILIGNSFETKPILSPQGCCLALPLPHIQKPELLNPSGISSSSTEEDPLERPDVAITRVVAGWIGVYLYRLLQSRDLDMQATRINLRTGQVNSTSIFGGRVALPDDPAAEFIPGVLNDSTQTDKVHPDSNCPACGGRLVYDYTRRRGVEIGVRFCSECAYCQEVCPECWIGRLEDGEAGLEEIVPPALCCTHCDWLGLIPLNCHPRQ